MFQLPEGLYNFLSAVNDLLFPCYFVSGQTDATKLGNHFVLPHSWPAQTLAH